jgi:hypothetical protein
MDALRRLENGGYTFDLTEAGRIAYCAPAGAPAEWLAQRAQPLLAEVAVHQEEVMTVLRARQTWNAVWDEWTDRLSREPADLDRDIAYRRRLLELAIAGRLPCYDGGQVDLGPEGWQNVTEREIQTWIAKENGNMGIQIEQSTFEAVPTGEYRARITAIEPVEGKFGPQLQLKCEIAEGDHAGATFLSWVSPKFSPKSRLYGWVEAAFAADIPKTYTFDSDHLIGREVVVTLVVRELDGGGEVNRVDSVRAVRKEQEGLPF